jgi:hypothetical protein
MQVPQSIIYLYSKYSAYCTSFNELISNSGIDYIIPVCIDNKDVRIKILSNNTLTINMVPCILFVYPNGSIEKYEGDNCFLWINDLIAKSQVSIENHSVENFNQEIQSEGMVSLTSNSEIRMEEKEEVIPIKKSRSKKKKVVIPDESEEEQEDDYQSNLVRSSSAIAKKEVEPNKLVKTSSKSQLVDEELGLESRPRNETSGGSNLIDLDEILGDRRTNEKLPIKGADKGNSIMARAQEMQKSREQEDVKSSFKNKS